MIALEHKPQPVSAYLSASPSVRTLSRVEIGYGRCATIWRNCRDHLLYESPVGNTFSFYLNGGQGTRRVDGRSQYGRPGAVCVMPQGCSSEWDITADFDFLHLYVPEDELRRCYGETLDRDARLLNLAERTYVDAQVLAVPFASLAAAVRAGDVLSAESATTDLLVAVFTSARFAGASPLRLTGGLAPGIQRRLEDYIDAHLDETIRLRDLAGIARLSDFHFQRSFRESVGVTPHRWITHRRIARARLLIQDGVPLSQVATACGFSSQAHLSRTFAASTGIGCRAFRQAIRGGR